ncbi:MAG: NYN domain-containing protein, partial [Ilumatobacter sp.]
QPSASHRSTLRRRVPIALPGGVISTSAEAADFLVRSDALVVVDGYNVAKLGWPNRSLEQQRTALVERCENLARRCGTEITVVFDGASVAGAHTSARRTVRVVYSPAGVSADDVIRAEVEQLPTERGVAVVTNDREVVGDVRAAGANVVPSNAFIAVF